MSTAVATPTVPAAAARPAALSPAPASMSRLFLVCVVLAICIWGGNWPVMKFGSQFIPPLWFAASRFLSAAILSFVIAVVLGKLRLPTRQEWPVVVGVGVLQMGLFTALVTGALHFVMPGRASLIAYATSIWVVPGAALVLKQKLSPQQSLATVCSYAGMAVIVLPALLHADLHSMIGYLMLGVASLSWAMNILQIKMSPGVKLDFALLPWQTLVAALPLSLLALAVDGAPSFLADPHAWGVIAYTGPLATALTFLIVLQMTQRLSPVTVSVCMLGVPVVGLTLSSLVFGERLSSDLVLGMGLLCLGLVLPALPSLGLRRLATKG
ncbi:DMT family transporter [Herbaspirillum seropedicae]|uniref:Permease of the drug/metabolite transporter (DMT) superfamily protein n=1 Tax=Herbaspirillum seropedicae (strain SmR1) TaxID=757424 RepID=D8IRC4_HERSS|nr:DMT family transporter [Herbaspirillum seropedicae]ADJ65250.1 permease of the drug/metabolite transporter (DMT) superfamily protein [Herbaspirillum seropedicae SmR1]AKN67099.1 membrane protein [Herbaspirillum seropedicae]NQE30300.1 membrane protein [Herbaspirillum seropedicae]UMU23105.1 DMT family transporter [Herbaspirillum seropedicae]